MRVLGRNKLIQYSKKHADAKNALEAWYNAASDATWNTPNDVRGDFKRASILSDNRVIFRLKGNHYRLAVEVEYQNGVAVILWIGTHAEYDKKTF